MKKKDESARLPSLTTASTSENLTRQDGHTTTIYAPREGMRHPPKIPTSEDHRERKTREDNRKRETT